MHLQSPKLIIALLATIGCFSATAAMFRWVDENGVTHYSQSPPPSGDAVRLKEQPAPSAEAVKAAQDRLRRQQEQASDRDESRKKAKAKQAKETAENRQRVENCAAARANLEKLQNLGPRMLRTADGKYRRLSEQDVETQIAKAKGQIETYCK